MATGLLTLFPNSSISTTTTTLVSPSPRLRSVSFRAEYSTMAVAAANNTVVRVAAAQMTSINDLTTNFNTCSHLVKEAVAAGAKLLCLPENFSFVGAKDGESIKIAEPLDGPIMQKYCSLASIDCLLISGSLFDCISLKLGEYRSSLQLRP